jgi:allantoinase
VSDHGRFAYSPIVRRPAAELPNGARVGVWVVPNIEYYHYGQRAMSVTEMTAALAPDVLNHAWREYGARVGVWRLMDVLTKHEIAVTAALNSEAAEQYPQIIEEGNKRNWEWMAHGPTNSMLFTGMPEEAERPIIAGVLESIRRTTGKPARGWLGPALTETDVTLDLLAEAGVEYVADWCNDEQPYTMTTRGGSIVAMPYTIEIGDIPAFLMHGGSGNDFEQMITEQFDQLYEEKNASPRFMAIALHPFLVGHPYRARALDRALAHLRKRHDVWFATGSEILDWYRSSPLNAG